MKLYGDHPTKTIPSNQQWDARHGRPGLDFCVVFYSYEGSNSRVWLNLGLSPPRHGIVARQMPTHYIDGVPVEFPYAAYPCQLAYMGAVVRALESGQNALLEFYLKAVWLGIFGPVFLRFSVEIDPGTPLDRRGPPG